jgi:hypothetical protein
MNEIKILIGCIFFSEFTGSEMYVYELAKNLKKLNCNVSVVSAKVGGSLTKLALSEGIKVYTFDTLPTTEQFDIIHCQHTPITAELIRRYPNTNKIVTIHSEVNSLEHPVKHPSIKKYIAIRPEIKDFLMLSFGIPLNNISLIYNPIDNTRYNTNDVTDENSVLFVGTIDHIRKNAIFDILQYTLKNDKEFWLVGKNHQNYLNEILKYPHVKYYDSVYDVEKFVKRCSETAGILLGRTTIEGWMCGKPGWIYDINPVGQNLGKSFHLPPNDIEKFYSINVTNQIKNEYLKILQK